MPIISPAPYQFYCHFDRHLIRGPIFNSRSALALAQSMAISDGRRKEKETQCKSANARAKDGHPQSALTSTGQPSF